MLGGIFLGENAIFDLHPVFNGFAIGIALHRFTGERTEER
jgi:hypothetical protein